MAESHCTIVDYAGIEALEPRLAELAEAAMVLLPVERREDGQYVAFQSTKTTLKLLSQAKVSVAMPVGSEELLYKDQRGLDWYGPVIFVGASLLLQDPNIVSVAMSLIASYVYDFFGGSKDGTVHLSVVVEETKTKKRREIRYKGPVDGLKGVAAVAKSIHEGKP
jgi:hypothetical protein